MISRCPVLLPALALVAWACPLLAEEVWPAPPGSARELFDPRARPLPPATSDTPAAPDRPGTPTPTTQGGEPSALEAPIWAGMKPADRERRKLKNLENTDWGFVKSEFVWQSPEPGKDSPFERGEWSTEDLFAVPLTGPVYLFTEVAMNGQYSADQAMKVVGRTGVLWKMPLGEGNALEVRGGPAVKYNDALKLEKGRDPGQMQWEVKAKAPLIGPLGLEYLGEALPALTPEERTQLKSDVFVFLPVSGGAGKIKLGAKHRWESGQQEARSTSNLMQLYLGLEIGR